MNKNRTEWVMHVWGKKRDTLELNEIEKFHIDLLGQFQNQAKKFDKILVNIALDDINDIALFDFLKSEIGKALSGGNVEFKCCQNDKDKCEYVTFRPYVFDRIGENVDIFYSHFKGYHSCLTIHKESFPVRVADLCEMFWSYIMYQYSLNLDDVKKNLRNNSVYCWFVLKNKEDAYNIGYCDKYYAELQNGDIRFKDYIQDDLHKHCPGSFVWYNMRNIGESLKDKPLITSVSTDYLIEHSDGEDVNLCGHFCEIYLMAYLKESECYSVNDFNDEIHKMYNTIYTSLYPAKTIGKEYIRGFEKYLIENKLI